MVLLAGCGTDVEGTALAGERWDPCSITQDSIEATGLDPAFRDEGWGKGITVAEWSLCTWQGPAEDASYFFKIKSSERFTIADARANNQHLEGVDIVIGGREAFKFTTQMSRSITDCNIAFSVQPGVVVFSVDSMGTMDIGADPCELVSRHATDLEHLLPPPNL